MLSRKIDFRRRILSRGAPRLVIVLTAREPERPEYEAQESRLPRWALLAAIAAILGAVIVICLAGPPPPTPK